MDVPSWRAILKNLVEGVYMAIKSSTFGRVELSGQDAKRFVQRMNEVKPDPAIKQAALRGRAILARMNVTQKAK